MRSTVIDEPSWKLLGALAAIVLFQPVSVRAQADNSDWAAIEDDSASIQVSPASDAKCIHHVRKRESASWSDDILINSCNDKIFDYVVCYSEGVPRAEFPNTMAKECDDSLISKRNIALYEDKFGMMRSGENTKTSISLVSGKLHYVICGTPFVDEPYIYYNSGKPTSLTWNGQTLVAETCTGHSYGWIVRNSQGSTAQ